MKKQDIQEQGVFDPVSGKEITGDLAAEAEQKFRDQISGLIEEMIRGDDISEKAEGIAKEYSNSMKKPHEEALKDIKKYEKMIVDLKEVGRKAEAIGFSFEITAKPELSFHFDWNTDETGVWITFKKDDKLMGTLFAMPIADMNIYTYGPYYVGGTPPAADILFATENMILFVSQESTPPEEIIRLFPARETADIPCCSAYRRGALLEVNLNDMECVDIEASPSKEEVMEYAEKMDGISVLSIGTSGYPDREIIPVE